MARVIRMALIVAVSLLALVAIVFALAWAFIPREWIRQEASRQAARMSGMDVRFQSLEPGIQGLSLGVRVRGLSIRDPARGDVRLQAEVKELFVRLKLLPLLVRRVELAAASVRGGTLLLVDRAGAPPPTSATGGRAPAGGAALVLPDLRFEGIRIRSRDPLGGGVDLAGVSGRTSLEGALPLLRALRLEARAESLWWKPSAKEPLVPLPGPLRLTTQLEGRDGGHRLEITRGSLSLGPLESTIRGTVSPVGEGIAGGTLDIRIRGKEAELRSEDAAWRALASKLPAALSGSATWEIRMSGPIAGPTTTGTVALKPLSVAAGPNRFQLDEVRGRFSATPDRQFRASAEGRGSGVTLSLEARGSSLPGGSTQGSFYVKAPAARLNGIVPNAPTWQSGTLECRALFRVTPPLPPQVRWTVTGRDLNGSSPGLPRPMSGLRFDLEGDASTVQVRALSVKVGSTTASATGTVRQGKPLGSGDFRIALDRLVAEEWTPPRAGGQAAAAAPPRAAGPPPIPLSALDASIEIGELRSGGLRVRNLVAPVRYRGGTLSVAPIEGAVGTGTLAGRLDIERLAEDPSYNLQLRMNRAPVQEVATGLLPFGSAVSGLLSGTIDLSGPGLPGPAVSESLRGAIAGTVEQGKILESPALASLRSSLGIGSDAELAFRTIAHALRIDRGRLVLDRVRGDMGTEAFEMTGSVGLDQSLNLKLLVSLASARLQGGGTLGSLARYARDEKGRVPVEVSIGGTARAPKISLKPGRTLEAASKGLQRSLSTDLTRRLSRADSAGTSQDSTGADPAARARDALRRLLGK